MKRRLAYLGLVLGHMLGSSAVTFRFSFDGGWKSHAWQHVFSLRQFVAAITDLDIPRPPTHLFAGEAAGYLSTLTIFYILTITVWPLSVNHRNWNGVQN